MSTKLPLQEKRAIIVDSILPMLTNDIRKVCDAICPAHGRPGSGPNFTAALICLVACEVIGRLSCDVKLRDDDATVEFLRSVADVSGDERYRDAASPIVTFFRHGIAHSFLPKQAADVRGRVDWATEDDRQTGVCLEHLKSASGVRDMARFRPHHLSINGDAPTIFVVVPQILAVDVLTALSAFEKRIQTSDQQTLKALDAGFDKWWGRAASARGHLDERGRDFLRIARDVRGAG